MIHLLSMISDGSHIAHKSSILSTSLALYSAIHHDDIVYATEARKWYGVGLRRMKGRLLSLLPGSDNFPLDRPKKRTTICAEDVSMALMLAYYELFLPTSPNAYFEHILAVGRFLEALGPEMCQRGHLNDLFRTIRVHMVSPCHFLSLSRTNIKYVIFSFMFPLLKGIRHSFNQRHGRRFLSNTRPRNCWIILWM